MAFRQMFRNHGRFTGLELEDAAKEINVCAPRGFAQGREFGLARLHPVNLGTTTAVANYYFPPSQRDRLTLARRFNAGWGAATESVPAGRLPAPGGNRPGGAPGRSGFPAPPADHAVIRPNHPTPFDISKFVLY